MARKRFGHRQTLGFGKGVARPVAKPQGDSPGRARRQPQHHRAILHQHSIILPDAIPFQHGEFRAVQRPALAVAPDMGKRRDLRLARCQQLFHRKFRRGVQVHPSRHRVSADHFGGKTVQMRLVAGADLQGCGVYFGKALFCQPASERRLNLVARQQQRAAIGMTFGRPPRRILHLWASLWRFTEICATAACFRSEQD